MLTVTNTIQIAEDELEEKFIRSPGPGGQNVNKVSSGVQLRFSARNSSAISATVFARLRGIAGHLMTGEGAIVITATQFRSQDRNRQDARDRLAALIRRASVVPKRRRPTKPSKAARAKRTDQKTQRGAIKKNRGKVSSKDYS